MGMKNSKLFAHITKINEQRNEQTIKEHSVKVAEYAGEALKGIGLFWRAAS